MLEMVIRVGEDGTVFENSPTKTNADVRHEFVPEISIASRILNEPNTADRFREVSLRLKHQAATANWDIKRNTPTQGPPDGSVVRESVKRVRKGASCERKALLPERDIHKLIVYDVTSIPPSESTPSKSFWRRCAETVFSCCWPLQ